MPKPPDLPDFDKLNFITAYMSNMCVPPFFVFCEFAKEPAQDLLLVLFGIDMQDIVKEWLRPERGRYREPKRHGRKRPKQYPSLDINEYIASNPRAAAVEYPGLKLPGAKAIFYVGDQWDKVAITGAVLEGVTDIGFQGLLGVIRTDPSNCPTLPICQRHRTTNVDIPGIIPPDQVISFPILDASQFFQAAGPFSYTTFNSKWTMGWSGTVKPYSTDGCEGWAPIIWSQTRGKVGTGNHFTVPKDEVFHCEVSAELEPGEFAWPARETTRGSVTLLDGNVFCFGGGLW